MTSKNATKKCIIETRPKMLKEYLQDNTFTSNSSCSSSGFNSHPRRVSDPDPTVQQLVDQAVAPPTLQRSRSRSRAAAEAAITSFHKLLNAVKSFQHYSPPPPLTLPRSFSKKLVGRLFVKKKSNNKGSDQGIMGKVKVKDILRWRSFRDLEEPRSRNYHPCNYNDEVVLNEVTIDNPLTIITTTPHSSGRSISGNGLRSGSESSGSGSGSGSSWDELPCWSGNSGEQDKKWDKNNDVCATDPSVVPKEDNQSMVSKEEDKEQHSPVSVLDSPFREEISDEEFVSSFDKSLANMERTKKSLLQSIQWFESLVGVEQDDETKSLEEVEEEQGAETRDEEGNAIAAKTEMYFRKAMRKIIKGGQCLKYREECIKEMEKQEQWSKFEDEHKELGVELEVQVLSDLVNEVLVDLYG